MSITAGQTVRCEAFTRPMEAKKIIVTASQCQQSHLAKSNIHRACSHVAFRNALLRWVVRCGARFDTAVYRTAVDV